MSRLRYRILTGRDKRGRGQRRAVDVSDVQVELIDRISTCRGVCREDVWTRVGHGVGHHTSHGESTEVELFWVNGDFFIIIIRRPVITFYRVHNLFEELRIVVLLAGGFPAG